MRVFVGINVWLSAPVFGGVCENIIRSCTEHQWLLTSRLIRDEAISALERKFARVPDAPSRFEPIWHEDIPVNDIEEPANDTDSRLVASASRSKEGLIVTGDARVLAWRCGATRILNPRDAFVELFAPHLRADSPG